MHIATFTLNNGIELPSVGLGTYGLNKETMVTSIKATFEAGATLVDTASRCQYLSPAISLPSKDGKFMYPFNTE